MCRVGTLSSLLFIFCMQASAFSEIIIPDDAPVVDINIENPADFDNDLNDENGLEMHRPLPKKHVDQYLAHGCEAIRQNLGKMTKTKISRVTQYFTPMFAPGQDGGLQQQDRRACINVEGSCIVDKYLYNWASKDQPWGKRYIRGDIAFKFGRGSGQSTYNKTNALDPCRTVAADAGQYPSGTVIYIPAMRGKLCPQSGKAVDGCFIVGDVGGAIKGAGRFDFFTGECADYNKNSNTCADALNDQFAVGKGTEFYVIGRHHALAKELREETDRFINSDWDRDSFPIPLPLPLPF